MKNSRNGEIDLYGNTIRGDFNDSSFSLSVRFLLRSALLFPILFLIAMAVVIFWQIHSYRSSLNWVRHTQEVLHEVDTIRGALLEMETAMRGYILTGEETFLEPYHASEPLLNHSLEALSSMVAHKPLQAQRFAHLKHGISQWQRHAQSVIDDREGQKRLARPAIVAQYQGKAMMDRLRSLFRDIQKEEDRLLRERTFTSNRTESSMVIWLLGAILSLASLVSYFFFVQIRRLERAHDASLSAEHRATEDLKRSEIQLESFLENAPPAIYYKDLNGRILLVNRFACRMLGKRKEDLLGKMDHEIFPSSIADEFRANDQRVLAEGRPLSLSERAPVDGELHDFVSCKFPLRDSYGQLMGLGGISIDVTGLITGEEKLRQKSEQMAMAVQSARIGFYDWDVRADHVIFSEKMMEDWGFSSKTKIRTLEDALALLHPNDRDRVRSLIHESMEKRTPYNTQYRVVHPSGKIVWLEVSGTVTYDQLGHPRRFFGTSINITHLKLPEEPTRNIALEH